MNEVRAFVPWKAFQELLPFNIEVLTRNGMALRAYAAQDGDSSVLRSKEYVLFGYGLATLILQFKVRGYVDGDGYFMLFQRQESKKGITYWLVQSSTDQKSLADWTFKISYRRPKRNVFVLAEQRGKPGQYIYLADNCSYAV